MKKYFLSKFSPFKSSNQQEKEKTTSREDILSQLDSRNKLWSRTFESNNHASVFKDFVTEDVVIVAMGQSLAAGSGSWYPLSRSVEPNAFSLGPSVVDAGQADRFIPANVTGDGEAPRKLFPLVGCSVYNGSSVSFGDEQSVIPVHERTNTGGDGPLVSLVRSVARSRPDKRFFAAQSAFGGTPIGLLRKDTEDSRNYWQHFCSILRAYEEVARREERSISAPVIFIDHGQTDYSVDKSNTVSSAKEYEVKLRGWMKDIEDEIASVFPEQKHQPLFLLSTPSARYVRNFDGAGRPGLFVHEAMYAVADTKENVRLVPPSYAGGNPGGAHLDTNGYRLLGEQASKVLFQELSGARFMPTRVIQTILTSPRTILVNFHVPEPPLRFQQIIREGQFVLNRKYGFMLTDATGGSTVQISNVTQVADTILRIETAHPITHEALLWLGGKQPFMSGRSNICDSETTLSSMTWGYIPDASMDEGMPLSSLVGERYDLSNFALPHAGPVGWTLPIFQQ